MPTETLARWAWTASRTRAASCWATRTGPSRRPTAGRSPTRPTAAATPDSGCAGTRTTCRSRQLAFEADRKDGAALGPDDVREPRQTLDLWRGVVDSRFALGGVPVHVTTAAHPDLDLVAVRVESALLASGKLRVRIAFPRGHDLAVKNTPALDWTAPEAHATAIAARTPHRVDLVRTRRRRAVPRRGRLDGCRRPRGDRPASLHARLARGPNARVRGRLRAGRAARDAPDGRRDARGQRARAGRRSGGAAPPSTSRGSRDPRAAVLERRVVLSQYLTAVQVGGDFPPQESGLTCSTWYGKHHTEMMWWHTAHFALWGRPERLAPTARLVHARAARGADDREGARPAGRALAEDGRARGAREPGRQPADRLEPAAPDRAGGARVPRGADPGDARALSRPRPRDRGRPGVDGSPRSARAASTCWARRCGSPRRSTTRETSRNPSFELSYWRTRPGDRAGVARAARPPARARSGTTSWRGSRRCR